MKAAVKSKKAEAPEILTEAYDYDYEVRAFRDEEEDRSEIVTAAPKIPHARGRHLQAVKAMPKGQGEQKMLPDDWQFCDNETCAVET